LDAVQVLTDLDLSIKKAYISADGKWCMDGKPIVISFFHNWFGSGFFS